MNLNKKNTGFTLIELLVVISIIAMLSSIILSALSDARAKARDAKRLQDIRQIEIAMNMYQNDHNGNYPVTSPPTPNWQYSNQNNFLQVLINEKYLPSRITDPINTGDYVYAYDNTAGHYEYCLSQPNTNAMIFFTIEKSSPNKYLCPGFSDPVSSKIRCVCF
jgi:prepilin-type N-terminal cleavage/methylation domain-containing protein